MIRSLAVGLVVLLLALASPSRSDAEPATKGKTSAKTAVAKAPAKKHATTPTLRRSVAPPPDPREEQVRQSGERARLTERIGQLRKQIAEGERSRAGAASALKRAERELAVVNARLKVLDERRRGLDEQVATIDRQPRDA